MMKKSSAYKTDKKLHPVKVSNMRNRPPAFGASESDCISESQIEYIENLQQQIYVLENEVAYLRTHMHETSKQHPSLVAESEHMVKKLSDSHSEMKNMKIDLKRKQTSIDLLRSERDRVQKTVNELEERFRKEKCTILEDLITVQKEKDNLQDENVKLEQLLEEHKQNVIKLQDENDNLEIDVQQAEKEIKADKQFIEELQESKQKIQKELIEAKMILSSKPSDKHEEAVKMLKCNIEQISEELETAKRSHIHEHMLRERLTQDNADLIKRHAQLEAELADVKAQLREEQSLRSSLEQIHLGTVLESAENLSRENTLKDQIQNLTSRLQEETETTNTLEHKLSDEKRQRIRGEERFVNIQERLDQKEEQLKVMKKENVGLWRDNSYLTDQVTQYKQQLQHRDDEIVNLKLKVQEMQISVEKFIQSNQAATQLAGEKWKQLSQMVQSMQALTNLDDQRT
ncbi:outer dense fiber protein 2 isoform X2 [Parasteatoda tepidariorum]|uniref:outer dense fiber protein 2 isoform X2 n=1 Tax=Parasteatoda tepidariorum TaxID=114398 RepID=UPI001C72673D|nr:myosin-11 isoform X1 [Parasteatoda tepidariorum]